MKKGSKHSPETLAKMKQNNNSPEHRQKMSDGMRKFWDEMRELKKQKERT